MRGKKNLYRAKPIKLWWQVIGYTVLVNHVPVCRVSVEREGLRISEKFSKIRLNTDLVFQAVQQAHFN